MPRVYRLPQFNTDANIWNNALPADLSLWNGAVPARAPDLSTICQLYYPRYGIGRWLHALSDNVVDTLLKSGFQELRCPKDTPVSGPWGVNASTTWAVVPLVECPRGSGRLYAGVMIDQAHIGFINEYRVVLLSQLANRPGPAALPLAVALGASGSSGARPAALPLALAVANYAPPSGARAALPLALAVANYAPPSGARAALPLALAVASTGTSNVRAAALPLALALGATGSSGARPAALPLALALGATGSSGARPAALPLALSLQHGAPPTFQAAALPLAIQLASVTSSGGGTVAPSATCAGANLVTLPFNQSGTVPMSGNHWFKFTATAVLTHIRVTCPPGNYSPGALNSGACGSQTQLVITDSITTCRTTTPAAGTIYIRIDGSLFGAINYTIDVGTGAC